MNIVQMHHEVKLQCNKVDTLNNADFLPYQIDAYIQRGIWIWVKDRIREFEESQGRLDNLGNLHIKSPAKQPVVTPTSIGNGLYEYNLNNLDYPYFRLTKVETTIQSGTCSKKITTKQFQTDDEYNVYTEPNFKWSRVNVSIGESTTVATTTTNTIKDETDKSIYFDTNNQFLIGDTCISFIRKPRNIWHGTYNHINNKDLYQTINPVTGLPNPPIDSDIDSDFHDEIIRLTVQEMTSDYRDPYHQIKRVQTTLDSRKDTKT